MPNARRKQEKRSDHGRNRRSRGNGPRQRTDVRLDLTDAATSRVCVAVRLERIARLPIRIKLPAALRALREMPVYLRGFAFWQFAVQPRNQSLRKLTHCISPLIS